MVRTNRATVGGFFLAGRSMIWWPVSFTAMLKKKLPPLLTARLLLHVITNVLSEEFTWGRVICYCFLFAAPELIGSKKKKKKYAPYHESLSGTLPFIAAFRRVRY